MTEEDFYHYTSENGAAAILYSGKVRPSLSSSSRDASYGDGVYLTTLEPRLGRNTIAKNNWDGVARRQDHKMKFYSKIKLFSSSVRSITINSGL